MRLSQGLSQYAICITSVVLSIGLLTQSVQAQTAYRWVDQGGRVHYSDQPPSVAEAINVQKQKLKSVSVIETSGPGYETKQAMQGYPLTLYTSENCKEACKQAREFLDQRGAPYSEKVLHTAVDADDFRKVTRSEALQVPVLMAGKKIERGFELGNWHKLLNDAGYPSSGDFPSAKKRSAAKMQ